MSSSISVTPSSEELLSPFLRASNEQEEQVALARLTQHVRPVIERIVRRKLSATGRPGTDPDADDLCQAAILTFIRRIRQVKESGGEVEIRDVSGYAASIAFSHFGEYLRKRRPKRWSLEGKVRYIAKLNVGIEIWGDGDESFIGRTVHRQKDLRAADGKLRQLLDKPDQTFSALFNTAPDAIPLAEVVAKVVDWLGGAASFDPFVSALANALGCRDEEPLSHTVRATGEEIDVSDPSPGADVLVEMKESLRTLWTQVLELPVRQRVAILLNLRDQRNRGVIALMPLAGIATFEQIAECLEMSPQDLQQIWGDLPIEDTIIASRLGISAQDVANLRMVGRARLKRRMAKEEKAS